jgi:hypothetical protein
MSGTSSRKNILKKAPSIGELINPIVLAKKVSVPDTSEGAVGWVHSLEIYRSAMAKIVERNRETSDPSLDFNEDNTHEFIIRTHIAEKISRYVDVVLHDSMLYQIQYVTRVVDGIPFVKLVCTEYMPIEDYEHMAVHIEAPTKDLDDETQFPNFGQW